MKKIEYWYIGGDIHGDWRPIRNWVVNELKTPREKSGLILLGDVGANYYLNHRDRDFKYKLNHLGIEIYCLRGNHEMRIEDVKQYSNYEQVFSVEVDGPIYTEVGYPHIHYLRDDCDFYHFGDFYTLAIPGAYSPDKDYRLRVGWSWFPNEQLNLREMERGLNLAAAESFDLILSHTCPFSWEKYIKDLFISDIEQNNVDKSMEKFLDEILIETEYYGHWYFGHFHDDRDILGTKATMLYKKIIPLGEYIDGRN